MEQQIPSSEIWGDTPDRIGNGYYILHELTDAGMARVVVIVRYGRRYIAKAMKDDEGDVLQQRERLLKEFDVLTSLNHPNIVRAIDFLDIPGLGPSLIMEYVEGVTLQQYLQEQSPSQQDKLHILQQLVQTVQYLHSRQMVHRDLKPTNVMVLEGGKQIKLIDFGLADSATFILLKQPAGTLGYASPEQRSSSAIDVRNDIYSLGIIMQQMQLPQKYAPTIRRCTGPIAQRPDATALLHALNAVESRCKSVVAVTAITLFIIICVVLLFFVRESTDKPQELALHESQDVQNQYISLLSQDSSVDSDVTDPPVTSSQSSASPSFDVLFTKGKRAVDEAVRRVNQIVDTLSHIDYCPPEFDQLMLAASEEVQRFVEREASRLPEHERRKLETMLYDYLTDRLTPSHRKIERLAGDAWEQHVGKSERR